MQRYRVSLEARALAPRSARSVGSQLGGQIVRGVLGSIFNRENDYFIFYTSF
jgi:hypothetical protein